MESMMESVRVQSLFDWMEPGFGWNPDISDEQK
jgi:hypothetical protein